MVKKIKVVDVVSNEVGNQEQEATVNEEVNEEKLMKSLRQLEKR